VVEQQLYLGYLASFRVAYVERLAPDVYRQVRNLASTDAQDVQSGIVDRNYCAFRI
jgi:hypothetical protein